jgi:hypothetical protein
MPNATVRANAQALPEATAPAPSKPLADEHAQAKMPNDPLIEKHIYDLMQATKAADILLGYDNGEDEEIADAARVLVEHAAKLAFDLNEQWQHATLSKGPAEDLTAKAAILAELTACEERLRHARTEAEAQEGGMQILAREMDAAEVDREILALRDEFWADHAKIMQMRPQWEALCAASGLIFKERGIDAAIEWEKNSGGRSVNDENNRLEERATNLVERMIELRPRTRAGIAAVAACFKADQDHLWKDPEPDRDWEVSLVTRFIDGLIECGPPAKTEEAQS